MLFGLRRGGEEGHLLLCLAGSGRKKKKRRGKERAQLFWRAEREGTHKQIAVGGRGKGRRAREGFTSSSFEQEKGPRSSSRARPVELALRQERKGKGRKGTAPWPFDCFVLPVEGAGEKSETLLLACVVGVFLREEREGERGGKTGAWVIVGDKEWKPSAADLD